MTPEREKEIRNWWKLHKEKNGWVYYGYAELIEELDKLRADLSKMIWIRDLLVTEINKLKEKSPKK